MKVISFLMAFCVWIISAAIWWALLPLRNLQFYAGVVADDSIKQMQEIFNWREE